MDADALLQVVVGRGPLESSDLPAKIPWHDPDFSERMLAEHLDQAHDRASRRGALVDVHVDWLLEEVMDGRPGAVLDLGCGPGLYTERLAALGCSCLGIDVSPASIRHARAIAAERGLDCRYRCEDFTTADLEGGHDVALLLYGELNTFAPRVVAHLLARVAWSLAPGGSVVLEVHPAATVRRFGQSPPQWFTAESGLFSDRPHLVLTEQAWQEAAAVTRTRHFVVDAGSGAVEVFGERLFAHADDDYRRMLSDAGFGAVMIGPGPGVDPHTVHVTAGRSGLPGGR